VYNVDMRKQAEPVFEYERLARRIEAKGWSLGQLEIQSGVSKSQISLMSRNERPNVSAAIVGKLAISLDVTTDYLLGLTNDPRHTFAINFLRNGGNPLELQKLLGHEKMDTVRLYVDYASADLAAAQRKASPADGWKL